MIKDMFWATCISISVVSAVNVLLWMWGAANVFLTTRFSGPQHHRVCEAILGDLRIARRQGVRGVVLEIFSRDQQVMGVLSPYAGPPELLGFDDRTMMYEGDAKDWEAKVHWHGDQLRR